jgi:thioredoxin reductase
MKMVNQYDVIIIGGSYSGLSSAMALGRSLRKVLVVDHGKPCNRYTPHSHNFITQDGETPYHIYQKAKTQVLAYPTVDLKEDKVLTVSKTEDGFEAKTLNDSFFAKKIILATGIKDVFPEIKDLRTVGEKAFCIVRIVTVMKSKISRLPWWVMAISDMILLN